MRLYSGRDLRKQTGEARQNSKQQHKKKHPVYLKCWKKQCLVTTLLRECCVCSHSCLIIRSCCVKIPDAVAYTDAGLSSALLRSSLLQSEASGQVGSILALWFKALGQLCCSLSWISLAYLRLHFTIGFFTFRVLHLNFNEVSAILGTSVITACITRAARQRGIVQMCQAANCLKQLL